VVGWLAADAGIVPVQPRRDVDQLVAWAQATGEPIVRLVTGAGGQGKTVLGRLVCEQLAEHGWLADFVRLPPPGWRTLTSSDATAAHTRHWLHRWAEIIAAVTALATLLPDAPGGGPAPVRLLLVVDYAENQAEALSDLLARVVSSPVGNDITDQVRLLLLARHDRDWWPQLSRDHPDHDWVDQVPLRLESLGVELSPQSRTEVWAGAVSAFAAQAVASGQLSDATAHTVTESVLAAHPTPPFAATTLDLYATALLVVLESHESTLAPMRARDPLRGVLDHEIRLVSATLNGAGIRLSDSQQADAVSAVVLTSAADVATAAGILARVPSLSTLDAAIHDRLAIELGRIYPNDSGDHWSAPTPDRLADTHLLHTLNQAPSDADAVSLIASISSEVHPPETWLFFLACLRAQITPGSIEHYPAGLRRLQKSIETIIEAHPEEFLPPAIAVAAAQYEGSIIRAINRLTLSDAFLLSSFLTGGGPSPQQLNIAVSVSDHAVGLWSKNPPTNSNDTMAYAFSLECLASNLANAGRSAEALERSSQAIDLFRRISTSEDDEHLAHALSERAKYLYQLGRPLEAVSPAQEAVSIFRRPFDASDLKRQANLAWALSTLGLCLFHTGRRHEGSQAVQESTSIRRRLAQVDPSWRPQLAISLNNLGSFLLAARSEDEALVYYREATEIRRELAASEPTRYLPSLAGSLNNLSIVLAGKGQLDEAISCAKESVHIRKLLAEAHSSYEADLGRSLHELSRRFADAERTTEALSAADESVNLYRRALADGRAREHELGMALTNLALRLAESNSPDTALDSAIEAVDIYSREAQGNPDRFLEELAIALLIILDIADPRDRRELMTSTVVRLISICQTLEHIECDPMRVAQQCCRLGADIAEKGLRDSGIQLVEAAGSLIQPLAVANPEAHLHKLAICLATLADLAEPISSDKALNALRWAVEYWLKLCLINPNFYNRYLESALNSLIRLMRANDRLDEADEIIRLFGGEVPEET
jgi:hypothetical protein